MVPKSMMSVEALADVQSTTMGTTTQRTAGSPLVPQSVSDLTHGRYPSERYAPADVPSAESAPVTGTNRYNSAQPALTGMVSPDPKYPFRRGLTGTVHRRRLHSRCPSLVQAAFRWGNRPTDFVP